MIVELLCNDMNIKKYLENIGVDAGGRKILSDKAKIYTIAIKNLHVGAANILKQDALSVGADLAVPRGTVIAAQSRVDTLLIATTKELKILAKKELAQPFGLKEVAINLQKIVDIKKSNSFELMGVINANDDSFFAGSRFKNIDAIKSIEKMIEDGADIIDIGAVSSRPNAVDVSAEEELQRVSFILDVIKKERLYEKVSFSIDSYCVDVVKKALESGFRIVNDITGFENDEICKVTAEYDAKAIIMHMQGRPTTMQNNPTYVNILDDIYSFLKQRVKKVESFGVRDIVLDVGIGFGKTLEDNISLIKNLEHFLTLEKPLLIGASRKSMIDNIFPSSVEDRLAGTLAIHLEAYRNGASIIRVHDVYEHKQALEVQKRVLDF